MNATLRYANSLSASLLWTCRIYIPQRLGPFAFQARVAREAPYRTRTPRTFATRQASIGELYASKARAITSLADKIERLKDWNAVEAESNTLATSLAAEDVWSADPTKAADLAKKKASLDSLLKTRHSIKNDLVDLAEIWKLSKAEGDAATMDSVLADLTYLEEAADQVFREILLPDPEHQFHCIVELKAGEGGAGAAIFLGMLVKMYQGLASRRGWQVDVIEEVAADSLPRDEVGAKRMTLKIEGEGAFGWLQHESGLHRVHRFSPTDKSNRRMTYIVSVNVLPLDPASEEDGGASSSSSVTDIEIPASDLKLETMRSSGAGGQSVNTTDSAVRITHIPTGIWVHAQVERSQHQNRKLAMRWLKAKLLERDLRLKEDEKRTARKLAPRASFGSDMVRTYSLNPTELLKDWATGYETRDVLGVLEGDMDELLEARLIHFVNQ